MLLLLLMMFLYRPFDLHVRKANTFINMLVCVCAYYFVFKCERARCERSFSSAFVICLLPCTHCLRFSIDLNQAIHVSVTAIWLSLAFLKYVCVCFMRILRNTHSTAQYSTHFSFHSYCLCSRVCLPHFFMSVWWWRWFGWWWRRRMMMMMMCVFIQFISVSSSLNRILIQFYCMECVQ